MGEICPSLVLEAPLSECRCACARPKTAAVGRALSRATVCPSPRVMLGESSSPCRQPWVESRLSGVPERWIADEIVSEPALPARPELPSQQRRRQQQEEHDQWQLEHQQRQHGRQRRKPSDYMVHHTTSRTDWLESGPSTYWGGGTTDGFVHRVDVRQWGLPTEGNQEKLTDEKLGRGKPTRRWLTVSAHDHSLFQPRVRAPTSKRAAH